MHFFISTLLSISYEINVDNQLLINSLASEFHSKSIMPETFTYLLHHVQPGSLFISGSI